MSLDEIAAFIADLPGVTQGARYGNTTWFVGGKGFAWERPFSKADIRRFGDEQSPDGPILAVRVADLGEKEATLATHTRGVFTIPHFDGYAAVLLQLKTISKRAARDMILEGWFACAPAQLAEQFTAGTKRRA